MRILLLEPDEYYHMLLKNLFAPLGELLPSRQGSEMFRNLKAFSPDVLIIEPLLDDFSGFELLLELSRAHEILPLPVIIFSKIDRVEDIETALNLGVSRYLIKGKDSIFDLKNSLLTLNPIPIAA